MQLKNNKKLIRRLIGLFVVIIAICSVLFVDWKKEPEPEKELIRPVKTIVVQENLSERKYQYLGTVEAADEAELSFEVTGSLKSLNVKKGERVKKGQLLASLDPRDFENALAVARADAEKARIILKRLKPAAKSGAVTKQQLTDAEATAATTAARLKTQIKAMEDTKLKASFDGIIADILVENFESVKAKQPIAILQTIDNVDVTVDVPESRIAEIDPKRIRKRKGDVKFVMSMDYFPDRTFVVTLKEFKTKADELTSSYKVTFTMPRPDVTILPGMPATVTETIKVDTGKAKGFLLPADAVPVDTHGKYFVWILTGEQSGVFTVQRQDVEVGEMTGDRITVTKGVSAGDRIAAAGVHILRQGQKVSLLDNGGTAQ
jgi:RND family efflux transporter MFP subunit